MTTRAPALVDPLAARPRGTAPAFRPCDDPLTCGIDGETLCPPCRDVADWRRLQQERFAERERLVPVLREFEALCKHFPAQVAEALLPVLAEGVGQIVRLSRGPHG